MGEEKPTQGAAIPLRVPGAEWLANQLTLSDRLKKLAETDKELSAEVRKLDRDVIELFGLCDALSAENANQRQLIEAQKAIISQLSERIGAFERYMDEAIELRLLRAQLKQQTIRPNEFNNYTCGTKPDNESHKP